MSSSRGSEAMDDIACAMLVDNAGRSGKGTFYSFSFYHERRAARRHEATRRPCDGAKKGPRGRQLIAGSFCSFSANSRWPAASNGHSARPSHGRIPTIRPPPRSRWSQTRLLAARWAPPLPRSGLQTCPQSPTKYANLAHPPRISQPRPRPACFAPPPLYTY